MARSQAPVSALLCVVLLAAALSPAAGQLLAMGTPPGAVAAAPLTAPAPIDATNIATTVGSGAATVPVAAAAGPTAAMAVGVGGEISANRTVGTQLVIPPSGCLVVSVTAAEGMCLQDASFRVNNQSIAAPADYQQAGIPGSNLFFNRTSYAANNAACSSAGPSVVQVYEASGCVLADAATSTMGAAAATDIQNSFVCMPSGSDTTNYARTFGATTQERRFCTVAARDAGAAVASGNGTASSGSPCAASRATYVIQNPCPTYNTTVNTTARFFLATDAPATPPPRVALAPPPSAASAPAPSDAALTPAAAPATAPAPAPGSAAAGPGSVTAGALSPGTAPAPAPQAASRATACGAAAATIATAAATLAMLA